MIGKLTGIIDEIGDDFALVDIGGVGYVVHCAARVLANLPAAGQRATLFVETQMREDAIKCRRQAETASDLLTMTRLTMLANEYDAKAKKIEDAIVLPKT